MTVVKTMVTGAVAMMAALMVVPVVARAQAVQSLATHRQLQGPAAPGIRKEDEAEKNTMALRCRRRHGCCSTLAVKQVSQVHNEGAGV
jgi:hypothetical protein